LGLGFTDRNCNRKLDITICDIKFCVDKQARITKDESENLRYQFGTSSYGGRRKLPLVFKAIRKLLSSPEEPKEEPKKEKIGFHG